MCVSCHDPQGGLSFPQPPGASHEWGSKPRTARAFVSPTSLPPTAFASHSPDGNGSEIKTTVVLRIRLSLVPTKIAV